MDRSLLSVGLDVGTTSTQLIVSRLQVEDKGSLFTVPEMTIGSRQILYESPVYFTPLLDLSHIDGQGVREILEAEYEKAGISRNQVDTGAVIITGETSRKENAQAVLKALSVFAGDFVVATAGPDLESRLAARGAGAVAYSGKTGRRVLHMDIGGGTSNLALMENGEILDTGCINVGGRLVKFDENRRILWVSDALKGIFSLQAGDTLSEADAETLAESLTQVLEMAAGLRTPDHRLSQLITREGKLLNPELLQERPVISFSGGVADCIEKVQPLGKFGDLGPVLGACIRRSRLCQGEYLLGEQTIRATVIGAGCYSTQLSGSTVYYQNIPFPLQNLPAVPVNLETDLETAISGLLKTQEGPFVMVLRGKIPGAYEHLRILAGKIGRALRGHMGILTMEQDRAKALGQALALELGKDARILSMDALHLGEGDYLDVGQPVGPAIPVVIKTLILGKG